jgi:hypothetical protein
MLAAAMTSRHRAKLSKIRRTPDSEVHLGDWQGHAWWLQWIEGDWLGSRPIPWIAIAAPFDTCVVG